MPTATSILLTAERLFATQGIAATSMRQISAESGQRNTAAAQYHFGDKDTLIRAIVNHRLVVIDARRRELLARVDPDEGAWPVLEALVRPLVEQASTPGSFYVRFLSRLLEHLERDVSTLQAVAGLPQAAQAGMLLTAYMPPMPEQHAWARGRWLAVLLTTAAADVEASTEHGVDVDCDEVVAELTDAATGLMTAPSSVAQRGR